MRVITGRARGAVLAAPKGMQTRPTLDQVKEGIFSAIQFEVEGRRVLDLFAGSGQLGIEALSRGAQRAVFVDHSREACRIIRGNLEKTGFTEEAEVVCSDYLGYLHSCRQKFDLIFLDPPYAEIFLENALKTISEIDILSKSGIIVCERESGRTLDENFGSFCRSRDYRYGRAEVTLYRRAQHSEG